LTRLLISGELSNSVQHSQKLGDKPVRPLLRSVLLGILLFLFHLPLYPQEKGVAAKEESLYSKALFASIAEMEKSYGHTDDSVSGTRIRTEYHHMLVKKDVGTTAKAPREPVSAALDNPFAARYHVELASLARCTDSFNV